MDTKTYIKVLAQFEGFHRYPLAPDEVWYLRNLHRHMFKVIVKIQVFHNDRELEFYMFKNWLQRLIDENLKKEETDSCETFCDKLYKYIEGRFPNRDVVIEVNEDGMEGAIKFYANKAR